MKTPEEMAYDYGEKFDGVEISKNDINIAWYDGYKAAQEQLDTVIASRDAWKEDAERYAENADYWKVQAAASQWVSAEAQLPERDGWALILSRNGTIRVRFIYLSDGCSLNDNGWDELEVIRWMPLPETIMD
jgi:hypothetical protein